MRVAIVVPVFGRGVGGGAITLARGFATEAARRGWDVEVWTTCAANHYEWRNVHPPGVATEDGIRVRRFPITRVPGADYSRLEQSLASFSGLETADQYRWLERGVHSAPLYAHIAARAAGQDAVIALPYAMPLVHYASWAAPERVLLWPCLHDEPYAYLQPTRLLMENVWGVIYNSPEEATLAHSRLRVRARRSATVGVGVAPLVSAEDQPVQKSSLLYMGRLEEGKNLPLLFEFVRRCADEGGKIELLVAGNGPLTPPRHPAIRFLGYISAPEKARLLASSLALCQPSLNESFSLTIMESWLAGRPVLVHGACKVTHGHVRRSQGGLWFTSYDEFAGAVEWLQEHEEQARRMGELGRAYVEAHYTWPAVLDRFASVVAQWQEQRDG